MKKETSIFISRSLNAQSSLKKLSSFDVYGQSLITFTPILFTCNLQTYDWLFIYSAVGVRYLLTGISDKDLKIIKIACLGPKTANVFFDKTGLKPDFIGDGNPLSTSLAFKKAIGPKCKILFARAMNSRQSVQKLLADYDTDDLVVYDNKIRFDASIPITDIVILTSPMNAECYFKSGIDLSKPRFIAIGSTTGDYMYSYLGRPPLIPQIPTEESITQLILSL